MIKDEDQFFKDIIRFSWIEAATELESGGEFTWGSNTDLISRREETLTSSLILEESSQIYNYSICIQLQAEPGFIKYSQ